MPRLTATLVLLLALLGLAPSAALADEGRAEGGPRADEHASRVVVLGTAGLRWSDLDPAAHPRLAELLERSAIGSLVTRSVRTASCPADGWLALGAGNRAGDAEPEGACRPLAEPGPEGAVPRWEVYVAERDAASYGSRLGLLGDLLEEHGISSRAVGPGAAIALARSDGTVPELESLPESPEDLEGRLAFEHLERVLVIDLGVVPEEAEVGAETRETAVELVSARAEAALESLESSSGAVMLVSLADAGPSPHLQLLSMRGFPGVQGLSSGETLSSSSTRQPGYVLATDLLPTILEALGIAGTAPTGALVGAPVRGSAAEGVDAAAMVALDQHATAIRALTPGFFSLLIAVNLALYAAVWLRGLRPRFRVLGVVVGALPVATFLANLLPWWRAGGIGLYGSVAAAVALVAALALAGPWRRTPLGPLTVVAGVTALTIVLDVLTGSRLQLGSLMGVHPLVAGRFYGLNNSAFSLLMVSSLLVAAVAGTALVRRGQRLAALGLVAVVGAVATVVDGMPGLGSDFGGPPALVPAFAVLGLLVAGVRVGWRRLLLVLGAGVLVVSLFAFLDWLRPVDSRTHLGRFVQTVLDGGLLDVIVRKLGQNLTILTSSWLVLLVGAGVALVVWLAGRGPGEDTKRDRGLLRVAIGELDALRVALPAAATGLVIGFAVNDSGVVIPAIGMSLGVPLVLASLARWREEHSPVEAVER